jgi:hypothetical protein
MEEENQKQETENLTEEQIIQLGEYAGVKKGQTYCNMNSVFTNFVYFLSALLGRPTEARTMNYDCFQRVFAELPADSFDRLNKTMKNMKEALDARDAAQTNSRKARSDLERAQEKQMRLNRQANRERHMADILKHVLMENRNLDEEFYEY